MTVSEVKRLQEEEEESLELYPAVEQTLSQEADLDQETSEEGYVPAFMRTGAGGTEGRRERNCLSRSSGTTGL